jgi:hypothetical protein
MNGEVSQTVPPVHSGEDLDQLLEAFFRSEMPDPWPDFAPPRVLSLPPELRGGRRNALRSSGHPARSRLALAASVALLLGGLWLLGSRPLPPDAGSQPRLAPDGGATRLPLPELPSEGEQSPSSAPEKVKSSLILEQGNDGTAIRIIVSEQSDR